MFLRRWPRGRNDIPLGPVKQDSAFGQAFDDAKDADAQKAVLEALTKAVAIVYSEKEADAATLIGQLGRFLADMEVTEAVLAKERADAAAHARVAAKAAAGPAPKAKQPAAVISFFAPADRPSRLPLQLQPAPPPSQRSLDAADVARSMYIHTFSRHPIHLPYINKKE